METDKHRVKLPWWTRAAIRDHEASVIFCRGGLGAAKSTNAVYWHLDRCLMNAAPDDSPIPSVSWVVAQTHGKIEDPTIPMFQDALFEAFGAALLACKRAT